MTIMLVLSALLFSAFMIRRGRRADEDYRDFPYQNLYGKEQEHSERLYGPHAGQLYPDSHSQTNHDPSLDWKAS